MEQTGTRSTRLFLFAEFFLITGIFVSVFAQSSVGEEPARAFLRGLRERGYDDVAIAYLESLETSRLAPPEMRQVLAFERALTLVAASRKQRDLEARFEKLDEAQALLRQFIDSHASHPKAYAARSELGNLIVERARIKVEESKTGDRASRLKEARKLYEQAFEEFNQLAAVVGQELDEIPKVLDLRDRKQAAMAGRRKQLRADSLQTELLAAAIREETADTVPDGSQEHTGYLTEAAKLYDTIYKKYRSRLAGLYARMYQGRCNQRLGKTKDALGYFGELLDQPSQPEAFWNLKTKTLRLAMESWLAPQQRKYVEAIKRASKWLNSAPRNTDRNPDMLAIRLSLARAYQMQAEAYEGRQPRDERTINLSLDAARKHADYVAGEPGSLQEEAQELAIQLGGRQQTQNSKIEETFTTAQKAGKKALDEIGPATQEVARIRRRLGVATPADRPKLQQSLADAEAKVTAARSEAMESYRTALQLADRDTPPSELNLVRYFVCYLYYLDRQYFEAALVGDFVARRYPQSAGAKQSAKIALACYLQLLDVASKTESNGDVDFEVDRVDSLVRWIAKNWPDSPEAIESLSIVIPVMVNAGRLELAHELTLMIPESSPERGKAEWVTGQAMWGTQLQRQQKIAVAVRAGTTSAIDRDAEQAVIDQLAVDATALFSAGYDRLPDEPTVDASNATAMLSYAQALVAASDPSKAVEVLEHEALGPLTLVDAGHEAATSPVFVQETLRTALQAFVGSMSIDPTGRMEKAKRAMTALQQAVGSDAVGKQRMLAIYINLAQSVEAQMKSATPESKQEMSKVFEAFLEELSAGSTEIGVLNWVAETFASLGSGFDTDADVLTDEARAYYERAIGAFANMLAGSGLQPALATQIRARMAAVKSQKRDYQGALDDYEQLLAETPNAVNLQVATARLLQKWAESDPQKFTDAITGIRSRSIGGIWGWGKIANATMSHNQFRDTFLEARYQLAACQFGIAKTKRGGDRKKQLAAAERGLTTTMTLYPALGEGTWTERYNDLLKQIRSTSGK